ncbi:hypothetical protein ACHAXT_010546 [Thalassiosira profunda]
MPARAIVSLILATLLLLSASPSFCLVLPDGTVRRQPHASSPSHRNAGGHPALLDAICNFPLRRSMDACRIFHGRGGLFEGANHLTLDYYPPVFLLTSFQPLPEEELGVYGDGIERLWDNRREIAITAEEEDDATTTPVTWVYQCRAQAGSTTTQLMSGQVPRPHIVTENNGLDRYIVHLERGQNHGLFLDMSAGRTWLREKCASGEASSVLNLFSYTCAFSVAALNGGAETVVNVDMSKGALKIGQRNHEINGLGRGGGAKFLGHDLFKSWGKLKRLGPYDCVVVDPPSYQKGSFVASRDYAKVIRRLPSLLASEGWALLCLNAPELDTAFLLELVRIEAPELGFVERLDNPPEFASAFPERALKVLVFQYRPVLNAEDNDVR